MHPRSIYKDGHPNFESLSLKYPSLATYILRDAKGRARIDFKNRAALRSLTRALLLEDFNLNVIFPEDSLVPTIPLRLNYILWIEDLLSLFHTNETSEKVKNVNGIDIGTGASTVYALIGARKNGWKMVGTESNTESIRFALKNVQRNNLDELVQIVESETDSTVTCILVQQVDDESILKGLLQSEGNTIFDFTMCNPPFFSSIEETDSCSKTKRKGRAKPSGAKTGIQSELIITGGEVKFIRDMIEESKNFSSKVRIFTTMVGVKKHLKPCIHELECANVKHYTTTEFSQGRTMRWGLAWTFEENINLVKPLCVSKTKKYAPLVLTFPTKHKLHDVFTNVKVLLLELKMTVLKEENMMMEVKAEMNTWSHQRRKRRERNRIQSNEDIPPEKTPRVDESHLKLQYDHLKYECSSTNLPSFENGDGKEYIQKVEDTIQNGLHFKVEVSLHDSEGVILLDYLDGNFGREGLNQVLQYLKNIIMPKVFT